MARVVSAIVYAASETPIWDEAELLAEDNTFLLTEANVELLRES